MPAQKKADLLKPLLDALQHVEDQGVREISHKYAQLLNDIIELGAFADGFAPQEEQKEDRQRLRATLQLIESRLLETNGFVLSFLDLLRQRSVTGKGELEQYWQDKLSSVMEDMKAVKSYLARWKEIVQGGKVSSKELFDAGLVWLRSRTDGPLARIAKKNQRLGTIINKMQRAQAVAEAKAYIRNVHRIL